jgi:two-component system, chemotaxis family, chemotaxis protein CheY
MPKKIALVGHCGPDSGFLRRTVKSAIPDVTLLAADDDKELQSVLETGVDLLLFNRELGYGFEPDNGVEMIRTLRPKYPTLRMMLVSNHADAQAAALKAGAFPGFGKRQIGSSQVLQILRDAVAEPNPSTPNQSTNTSR